jgi:hypothetical protein
VVAGVRNGEAVYRRGPKLPLEARNPLQLIRNPARKRIFRNMKRIALLLIIPLWIGAFSPVSGKEKAITNPTPTEDSKKLADKQIDQQIDNLKDALAGMRSAVDKGDRASFKLYRMQAHTAIQEIDKLATLQVETELGAAIKATPVPSPTPTPESTPTPTPTPEATPTPTPMPTPEVTTPTPTPEATPTPK